MHNRLTAFAIAIGLSHDTGADAAPCITLGRPVQMSAGACCPRGTDPRFGAPGHGAAA